MHAFSSEIRILLHFFFWNQKKKCRIFINKSTFSPNQDSESLEDLSQTDAFRNKQAKRRSMTPTDEEGGPNVMTSSYERDEQKYSAEEKG